MKDSGTVLVTGISIAEFIEMITIELQKINKAANELKEDSLTHQEVWLTEKEVCEMLKISKPKFYDLVRSGALPKHRIGQKTTRYLLSDLQAMLSNH